MVYVEKDGKKMVACCTEGQEVCPVVMVSINKESTIAYRMWSEHPLQVVLLSKKADVFFFLHFFTYDYLADL